MFRVWQWRGVAPGKAGKFFSQKASKVGHTLEILLGLKSDTKFHRLRNWNLSAHESNLFSQEQTCIRHAHEPAEWNPNAINFFSVNSTIIAQLMMLQPSDPISFLVDSPI